MTRKKKGRPFQYRPIIEALEKLDVYSPAKVAQFAKQRGLSKLAGRIASDTDKLKHQRIRIALARYKNNHNFPEQGDGMVSMPKQPITPGWFGWRWQSPLYPGEIPVSGVGTLTFASVGLVHKVGHS